MTARFALAVAASVPSTGAGVIPAADAGAGDRRNPLFVRC